MAKDAFYFPHFCNARHDRKIKRVRKELGVEGYGIFFMILEVLREQTDYRFPIEDIDLLADEFGTSEQKVRTVISNYELFHLDDDEHFFSSNLIMFLQPYFEGKEKKRISGIKGNLIRHKHFTKEELEDKTDIEILKLAEKIDGFSHCDPSVIPNLSQMLAKENKRKENKVEQTYIEPGQAVSVNKTKPKKSDDPLWKFWKESITTIQPDSTWSTFNKELGQISTLTNKTRNLFMSTSVFSNENELVVAILEQFIEMREYGRDKRINGCPVLPSKISQFWAEITTAMAERSRVVESNDNLKF